MMWFLGTRSSTAKPQLSSRYVKFWPCQAWRSQIAAPTAQKTTSLTVLPVGRRHGSFSTPHCQFFGIFVQNCQIYFFIISTFFALFNNFQDMSHKFHCMVFYTFTQSRSPRIQAILQFCLLNQISFIGQCWKTGQKFHWGTYGHPNSTNH